MRRTGIAAGALALGGVTLWLRANPSACPYSQRWMLEVPRPFIGPGRLIEVLEPAAGETLLELGPGTGAYTLPVAERLGDGTLHVFDLQQQMLDLVARRASERGLSNIVPHQGDATSLPYDDDSFDGAFLVTVIGEIPDQDAALRELARVVRPGGRVVFGEMALDPHVVPLGALRRRCERARLRFDRRTGGPLGFFARFTA